jgi:hypothetical protein
VELCHETTRRRERDGGSGVRDDPRKRCVPRSRLVAAALASMPSQPT